MSANRKNGKRENDSITIIEPEKPWKIVDLKEIKEYRDLFLFLVWRDVKVLYAQTIMGFSWAILQPLAQIVIFTIIFGKVAKIDTGGIPYFLFSSVAVIPWTFMSVSMIQSSQSLVVGQSQLGKIYFPRIIFPLTPIFSKLVDFGISLVIIVSVLVYYRVVPSWNIVFLPFFILLMICVSAGVGMWLSAMAIRFRDVKYAMGFLVRMLMYSAPIVYSAATIPDKWRLIYSINPIVGIIEGFRGCLLGTELQWIYIFPGILSAIMLLLTGALYFNHMEKIFVDVI